MVIQEIGRITRNKVKVVTFIQTDRNMMVNGHAIKSQAMGLTNIRTGIFILVGGRMIGGQVKEK